MEWLIVLCYIAALVLILAEFLVPGGILGSIGAVLLIVSCGLVLGKTDYGFIVVVGQLAGVAAAVVSGMYLLAHTGAARAIMLDGEQLASEGWTAPAEDPGLVGANGEVYSALRPAGSIVVDGRRIDAVSTGDFIEKGENVRVIDVEGNRVVVEQA